MRTEDRFASELKGHHVLMALVGFFGVMLIVNAIFVYLALATFSAVSYTHLTLPTILLV